MDHHEHGPVKPKLEKGVQRPFLSTPAGFVLCVFLAIGGVFLLFEHRVHLLGAWPLLFLLICVGMHFFMHRGHGGHGEHKGGSDER